MPLNHLAGQQSPYLLQHADNPVDWYPWGPEAFHQAHRQDKPILLSIGYSTCHWCHVMAHESFENQDIASIINEHFIAIKVDREERPDLDQIYMRATTALTGQGGWPLTVFLTAEGKPFYGGTYFPPLAKWGSPGLVDLLKTIAGAWKNERAQILSSSEEITQLLRETVQKDTVSSVLLDHSVLDTAYGQISGQFDRQYGGFGSAPKFPMGHYLSFLLRYYKRKNDPKALKMVEAALTAMAQGGIYDHLGGGFHRYSTDARWRIPHFEKMLYDQALLVRAYLECYQATGKSEYARVAKETLDYVLRDMQQPQGGFYCAQDADSLAVGSAHQSEGAFYIWSQQEVSQLLTEKEAQIFNYAFGIEPEGNAAFDPHGEFVGKNILYAAYSIEEVAAHFEISTTQAQEVLSKAKVKLLEHRHRRPQPHLDDKILTDWNGLMLGTLALGGAILHEPRYTAAAKKAADFILTHLKSKGRLLHRWRQEQADILATLEDYAFFINGLLDLYETDFEPQYLAQAQTLAEDMIRLFEDQDRGGFFLTACDAPQLIIRPKDIYDGAIPSGNSVGAYTLVRLHVLTLEDRWILAAEGIFKVFAASIEKTPSAFSFVLCALDFYLGPSLSIVLEGQRDDSALVQMSRVVYKHFIPNKSAVLRLSPLPLTAHVCRGTSCQKPTRDMAELENQLLS
ncbi:MAG: thioredoxin domain-containing protein [Candidatus Omnitrophica bacterium]|nr:thioredoxin domain-containing protein [Candidatus Omnitrophota bacterium]